MVYTKNLAYWSVDLCHYQLLDVLQSTYFGIDKVRMGVFLLNLVENSIFFIPFVGRVEYTYDDGGMIKVYQTSTFH